MSTITEKFYILCHKQLGYYADKQPDYAYSWTQDVHKAKRFKTLGKDSILHYCSYANECAGEMVCDIKRYDVESSIHITECVDRDPIEQQYEDALCAIEEYDDVDRAPNKKWELYKSLRLAMIIMGKLKDGNYVHKSMDNKLIMDI